MGELIRYVITNFVVFNGPCYRSMPFGHAEFPKLRAQILSGQFFAPPDSGEFSDAHELICQCLTVSSSNRATIDQISMHWWTNIGYIHYSHCDIYSVMSSSGQPTMCSCFFDVLAEQLSKPPDSFCGKLALSKRAMKSKQINGKYVGVHAHKHCHKRKHKSGLKVNFIFCVCKNELPVILDSIPYTWYW